MRFATRARTGRIAFVGLVVAVISACGGGNPSSPSAAPNYSGTFNGTTAQGRAISFTVSGNGITKLSIAYRAQGGICTFDGTSANTFATPLPINGNSFTYTSSSVTVTGTFSSGANASGSAQFSAQVPLPSTAPCVATGTTTWTATKG